MIVAQATLVKNNVIYVDAQEINQDCIIVQSIIPPNNIDIENQSFDRLYEYNRIRQNERRNGVYCISSFFCIGIIVIVVILMNTNTNTK